MTASPRGWPRAAWLDRAEHGDAHESEHELLTGYGAVGGPPIDTRHITRCVHVATAVHGMMGRCLPGLVHMLLDEGAVPSTGLTPLDPSPLAAMLHTTSAPCQAQDAVAPDQYRKPPQQIVKILEAPRLPAVSLDPTRQNMLLIDRETLPPVADLAQPMLRLAGARINPNTNGPHAPRSLTGLTLKNVKSGQERRIKLPADADLGFPSWSPDGSRFAFTITRAQGIELWVGVAATATARSLSGPTINAAAGGSHGWMPDSQSLLYAAVRDAQFGIYTIPTHGGAERCITIGKGHHDGPDASPDGAWIWAFWYDECSGSPGPWCPAGRRCLTLKLRNCA